MIEALQDFAFTSTLSVGLGGGMAISSPLQFLTMDEAEVARESGLDRAGLESYASPRRGGLTASAQ